MSKDTFISELKIGAFLNNLINIFLFIIKYVT